MPPLERKVKSALNDNRLLILGAQVLFGFQFNGVFQDLFNQLPVLARALHCFGLTLLVITIGCLIAPSMHHRIVEGGQDSPRILALATIFAGWALLPFSIALAFALFMAMSQIGGAALGVATGAGFFALALLCWYVLGFLLQRKVKPMLQTDPVNPTPIEAKVDQLLTEARVIIPGAQALFGFQLSVTLMHAFQELPSEAKIVHAIALCCIGLVIVLVMAPASLHRITFAGEDDLLFLKIGSMFVIAAPVALALGIALDTYVAVIRAIDSRTVAAVMAVFAVTILFGLWYAAPIWVRLACNRTRR
jgi:hypothetical protein